MQPVSSLPDACEKGSRGILDVPSAAPLYWSGVSARVSSTHTALSTENSTGDISSPAGFACDAAASSSLLFFRLQPGA
eukprot:363927-Chlamydomonas_euryale.AAC.7